MADPNAMTPAELERGTRILHAILAAGVAIIIGLFLLLLRPLAMPPLVSVRADRPIVAYVASGLGVLAILAAVLVLRPLARRRILEAPADRRWTDATRAPAILVWIVAEGGALAGCFGFVLTGSTLPAAVAAFGLVALLWCSPGRLATP